MSNPHNPLEVRRENNDEKENLKKDAIKNAVVYLPLVLVDNPHN
jgi:hypothetical protein